MATAHSRLETHTSAFLLAGTARWSVARGSLVMSTVKAHTLLLCSQRNGNGNNGSKTHLTTVAWWLLSPQSLACTCTSCYTMRRYYSYVDPADIPSRPCQTDTYPHVLRVSAKS